jgi:hypothetical protein
VSESSGYDVGRKAARRHNTMDMGMSAELLTPGMQHAEETDLRTEMLGIASDFEKCFRTGAKQEIVKYLLVLQH